MTSVASDFKLEEQKSGWIIAGYRGTEAHVVIPDEIDGKPVTLIAKEAFQENNTLKSVEVPCSVTFIGNFAFASCALLERVVIHARVQALNLNTFWSCPVLQDVQLPDSLQKLGDGTFRDCVGLRTLEIPLSVTEIGDSVFRDCKALYSIIIPSGVTSIQRNAFRDCPALVNVVIPDTLSYLGPRVFQGCSALESITISGSNISQPLSAFKNQAPMIHLVADYAIQEQLLSPAEAKKLFTAEQAHDRIFAARIIASDLRQAASFYAKRALVKTLAEGGCTSELRTLAGLDGMFDEALLQECIEIAQEAGKTETSAMLLDMLANLQGASHENSFDNLKL